MKNPVDDDTTTNVALNVLVTAHPDDESMFFLPVMRALISRADEKVWLICLSTGDYDGLGKIREKEMLNAGTMLGLDKTIVCDNLKDHPTERWPSNHVSNEIESVLKDNLPKDSTPFSMIRFITFDEGGVSGHVNHTDTYLGVVDLLRRKRASSGTRISGPSFEGWQLKTETNLISKYIPVMAWLWLLFSLFKSAQISRVLEETESYRHYALIQPSLNWNAMATHQSQFVWYRRLFVVFSCYTYFNKLQPIR